MSTAQPISNEGTNEAQRRAAALKQDLYNLLSGSRRAGRAAYYLAFFFMVCAITASVVAAVGGIFSLLDSRTIGSLALIPGVISLFPTNLKLQARANWHYRKKDVAQGLLNDLEYGLSDPPTIDEVRSIATRLTALNLEMGRIWEASLSFTGSENGEGRKAA